MRIFLGGSKGLVLYEDEELTQVSSEPLLTAVRATPSTLVVGTDTGSIMIFDGSGPMRMVAKDLGSGVQTLAMGANGALYAGTDPAGLWVSRDHGETWRELSAMDTAPGREGWTAPWGTPVVSCIAAHPKDPGTVFCGIEVGGILRSRDAGHTWTELDIPESDIHSVQICPARQERVYVTTGSGGYCSDDEGHGWRRMGATNRNQYALGLAAHPAEADRVIMSAAVGPPPMWDGVDGARCDIYLSTDAGRRFRSVVRGLQGGVHRKALVINSKVPSEIVFGTSIGELFYSNDGGESFDEMGTDLGNLRTIVFA